MEQAKLEAEQSNGNGEVDATSEQLVVEIPTEIRAGVVARETANPKCSNGTYACYSIRAQ